MKQAQRFALVAVLASSFAAVSPSHAQMGGMDMKDMDMEKCKGMDMSKWPAMSMTFTVKDKALLGKFSQDKKVEFEFVEQGSNYVITSVK